MIILSFDVGIKHLAYCLIQINSCQCNYTISSWDCINLCNIICQADESCDKPAIYCKNKMYYCKTHAKNQTTYLVPKINLKKLKLSELNTLVKQHHLDEKEESIPNKKSALLEFLQEQFLEKVNSNANQMDLIKLGINMKNSFDELFQPNKIDYVLIENQISPIATRMKTFQGMITQYFIMKDCYNIIYVSSINKLKHFITKKLSYKERKTASIDVTIQQLKENDKLYLLWMDFFNKHKKKDDLADCYLQGLWFIKDRNLLKYN
uniref:Mitochondrial resolvase Ydc2 catalytic domain-containing protein n=1 Tax=viral metagenome TaxID=1070528 RepID=A0A6C0KGA3_9ZZZZ